MNKYIILFLAVCIGFILISGANIKDTYIIEINGPDSTMVKCDIVDNMRVRHVYINVYSDNDGFTVKPVKYAMSKNSEKQSSRMYDYEYVWMGRQRVLHITLYPFYLSSDRYISEYSIDIERDAFMHKDIEENPLLSASLNTLSVNYASKAASPQYPLSSFLLMETDSEGIYRIDYDMLKEADITPELIDPARISIFTPDKSLLDIENPALDVFMHPSAAAFRFFGDDDKIFEQNEYILFYAEPVYGDSLYIYKGVDLYNNPYTDYNVYLLDFNSSPAGLNAYAPEFTDAAGDTALYNYRIFHYDSINPADVGYNWAWKEFEMLYDTVYKSYEYPFTLNSFIDTVCNVSFSFFFETDDTFSFYLYFNDSIIAEIGHNGYDRLHSYTYAYNAMNLKRNNVVKALSRNTDNSIKRSYLTDVRIKYKPDLNNIYESLHIESLPQYIHFNPQKEQYIYIESDRRYLGTIPSGVDASVYTGNASFVFLDDEIRKPLNIKYTDISGILNNTAGSDIIVITGEGMKNSVQTYASYRKKQGYDVNVYEINELYDAFTLGFKHPAAIKSLISYALNYWDNAPEYLLLLGSGSYDYKNRVNTFEERNVVPVYETGFLMEKIILPDKRYHFYTDRWFCTVIGDDDYIDIIPGRITALNANESGYALQKVMNYETNDPQFGKSRVMILADDEYSKREASYFTEYQFTQVSEELANILGKSYAYEKLYLMDYPGDKQPLSDWEHWPYDPGEKRQLTSVFNDIMNRGVDFGFFYGHGSYTTITHEHVRLYPEDLTAFNNYGKYPVFLFGTCNAGQSDSDDGCIAADLQKIPFSGFSASIAATRATFTTENVAVLENSFADDLLNRKLSTIGQYYMSMINYHLNTGMSHQLYGDPAMYTGSRNYSIEISQNDTFGAGSFAEYIIRFPEHLKGNMVFTAYQPEYRDSHDWYHVEPYRYISWMNNDGVMFTGEYRIDNDSVIVRFPIPDTFAQRDYTGRLLTNVILDAGELFIDNDNTNYVIFDDTAGFTADSGIIELRSSGVRIKDNAYLPSEYSLEVIFKDSIGIYQGNIDSYKPSVSINGAKQLLETFVFRDSLYTVIHNITSSEREDTVNITIFNNALAVSHKSVIIKHVTGSKHMEQFTLFPNPADDYVNVSFVANGAGYARFNLISRDGGIVISEEKIFTEGFNTFRLKLNDYNRNEISPGIYILRANVRFYDRKDIITEDRKLIKTEN